jgi:hypothetical protein
MAHKRITVTEESNTGRNERFHDNYNGNDMTRTQFVREIKHGNYTMSEMSTGLKLPYLIQTIPKTTT